MLLQYMHHAESTQNTVGTVKISTPAVGPHSSLDSQYCPPSDQQKTLNYQPCTINSSHYKQA